ncbi:MAG: ABC transporter ATP-binding protein [Acidimicrobiia bacterium]
MSSITFDHVGKVYSGDVRAITDVNLAVDDGEFVVLVGPSGCGKSTLLRMVAGLEEITEGSVLIGERVVNDVQAKDRDIAMVFQNYALYPHMTVFDNMAFGLKLRKTPKAEIRSRVEEAARILEITEFLERRPKALSGGQRQRVAMGRAIVREPAAFLLDEPLSNLDAKLRVQMRSELGELHNRLGTTTLYVTHDQVEAMTMGDRVAVMRKGTIQQVDTPRKLYDDPHNLFVAGFIGSPAMNFANAHLESSNGRVQAVFGSERLQLHPALLDSRPGIADFTDRDVVIGIRPEAFDAAPAGGDEGGRTLRVTASLVEQLGSEAFVHFTLDIPPVLTEDIRELLQDLGEDEAQMEDMGTTTKFTARVEPEEAPREGEAARLIVDTAKLHFFDPGSGSVII